VALFGRRRRVALPVRGRRKICCHVDSFVGVTRWGDPVGAHLETQW
jgi:hypothetical protein